MLPRLVLALAAANLLALAWGAGWLSPLLPVPGEGEREPQRAGRQVRPEAVRVLSTGISPVSQGSAATTLARCLETPPLAEPQAGALRQTLAAAALPAGVRLQELSLAPRGGVWTLYMGPYAGEEQLRVKQEQLRRIRLEAAVLRQGPEPGLALSIGRYEQRDQAEAALAQLSQRGLRTARVVALTPPQPAWQWRLEGEDGAVQAQLATWRAAAFQPCPAAPSVVTATAEGPR